MQLKYGTYSHTENEVFLSVTHQPLMSDGGSQIGYKAVVTINGRLEGASQSALTTALDALIAAYSTNGKDLVLLDNSGAETSFVIRSSETEGGTMVTARSWPDLSRAQYSTFIDYSVTVEAEYITQNVLYESYTDTLSVVGNGGPKVVLREVSVGIPVAQTTRQRTIVRATQSGSATKTGSPPFPAAKIFPGNLINESEGVTVSVTTERGRKIYTTSWNYQYQSQSGLSGVPVSPL